MRSGPSHSKGGMIELGRVERGLMKCATCQSSGCSPPSRERSIPVRCEPSWIGSSAT